MGIKKKKVHFQKKNLKLQLHWHIFISLYINDWFLYLYLQNTVDLKKIQWQQREEFSSIIKPNM